MHFVFFILMCFYYFMTYKSGINLVGVVNMNKKVNGKVESNEIRLLHRGWDFKREIYPCDKWHQSVQHFGQNNELFCTNYFRKACKAWWLDFI